MLTQKKEIPMSNQTAYDFKLTSCTGKPIDLDMFRGKPLMIVNTASKCKFTSQYEGLQDLWVNYRSWGFMVIGIPSGDFGNQEYKTDDEIQNECIYQYGVNFPVAQKSHVKGKNAIPLFNWLAQEGGTLARPRWNFYKYIINRQGRLSNWFTSITQPTSHRLINAIERVSFDI